MWSRCTLHYTDRTPDVSQASNELTISFLIYLFLRQNQWPCLRSQLRNPKGQSSHDFGNEITHYS
jgi:hypothetical protein